MIPVSIENTMQSPVNKRKYAHVGGYFAHLSIDFRPTNIARVGHGMAAGRGLASFLRRGTCRRLLWYNPFTLLTLHCMNELFPLLWYTIRVVFNQEHHAVSGKGAFQMRDARYVYR